MTTMKAWLVLMVLCILLGSMLVSSRTMWGVRKKQQDEEDIEDQLAEVLQKADKQKKKSASSTSSQSTEQQTRKVEKKSISRASRKGNNNNNNNNNPFGSHSPADILAFYQTALDKFEEILYSNQFDQYFNKETLELLLQTISEQYSNNVDLTEILEQVNIDDLQSIKDTLIVGVQFAKDFLRQANEALTDPSKLTELFDQIPSEAKGIVEALLSGDVQTIRNVVQSAPGVDPAQKKLVLDLLDGNYENVLQQVQQTLLNTAGNDVNLDPIEMARQNLLTNPELAVASGIPTESLQDPQLFKEFMQNSVNALLNDDEALNQVNDLFKQFDDSSSTSNTAPTKEGRNSNSKPKRVNREL